jgi:hypothetical protein
VLRAVVGGAVLAACGVLSPLCLFSGEHEVEELATVTSGLLLLLGLKIVATLACLTSGWFGGQIFPAIFAGMAAGLLVLQLFPSAPVTVVMAAGAGAAATAVLRRPLAPRSSSRSSCPRPRWSRCWSGWGSRPSSPTSSGTVSRVPVRTDVGRRAQAQRVTSRSG